MSLVSLQAGLPREVTWRGRGVTTGIFKHAVEGPVMARALNLDGDAGLRLGPPAARGVNPEDARP